MLVRLDPDVREAAIVRTYVDISKRVHGSIEDTIRVVAEDLGISIEAARERVSPVW